MNKGTQTTTKVKGEKTMKTENKEITKTAKQEEKEMKEEVKVVENKEEVVENIHKINNVELAKMFVDNGCVPFGKAKSDNVVYNSFATKSRVLMYNSKRSPERSQLLLTETDYEDFKEWYDKQEDDIKNLFEKETVEVPGVLSDSEKPRVKSVKVNNLDGLTAFIKFMAMAAVNTKPKETKKKVEKTEVAVKETKAKKPATKKVS